VHSDLSVKLQRQQELDIVALVPGAAHGDGGFTAGQKRTECLELLSVAGHSRRDSGQYFGYVACFAQDVERDADLTFYCCGL
jgi:hypothetical protein